MRRLIGDIRFVVAVIGGGVIAVGLFLLMHQFISTNRQVKVSATTVNLVNFVQVQRESKVRTKNYNLPKPPPKPKNPPPKTQIQTTAANAVQNRSRSLNVKLSGVSFGGTGVVVGNYAPPTNTSGYAPLTPMVRIAPLYPPQAAYQGVQGSVYVCFTVEPDGSVSSPYVKRASTPQVRRMLGQAALKNILQWKFFPRKVNGKPVATRPVCQPIQFRIPRGEASQGG